MLFDIHHFYVILLYKRINEDKNIKTTNRLLMREVPFPSLSLRKNKMTVGQIETVKSGKSLKLKGVTSEDVVFMIDDNGRADIIKANENNEVYKGLFYEADYS